MSSGSFRMAQYVFIAWILTIGGFLLTISLISLFHVLTIGYAAIAFIVSAVISVIFVFGPLRKRAENPIV